MKVLITGVAGFIGMSVATQLLKKGVDVFGIDNLNNYYDVQLKNDRLAQLTPFKNFVFSPIDICDAKSLVDFSREHHITHVIHMAAQAGVRFSIDKPESYVQSNLVGFANVLEMSRQCNIQHLLYASSSSVYGANRKTPFHENDLVRHPISFYAATKISNELMAHSYSHLFMLPVTGLRFFTVYGPWGRPDMSPLIFSRAIVSRTPIKLFAGGHMLRDFTYIDDVVRSIELLLDKPPTVNGSYDHALPVTSSGSAPYAIFNVGNSSPIKVIDYVEMLQKVWQIDAIIENLPMQAGDVLETYAATQLLDKKIGFMPNTDLETGLGHLVDWYKKYYKSPQ